MKTDVVSSHLSTSITPVALPEDEGGLNAGALVSTLKRKWWLIAGATVVTTSLAGARALTATSVYSGQFEILVQGQSTETEVISDVPNTLTTRTEERLDGDLLKLLRSPKILQPVVDGMRERVPTFCATAATSQLTEGNYDPCYNKVADRLSVTSAGKDSQIIQASFQDTDSQTVTIALDLLSAAYLEYSLASKQSDIRRGLSFVEQKLPDLRSKVDSLQNQLQALRINNNLIDPTSRGSQLAEQVGSFSSRQLDVQSQLRQLRGIAAELQQQATAPPEQASSALLNQNPRYQSLLNSLLELDAQIAEASTLYLEGSPDMDVLMEQRDNLAQLLVQQIDQSQREVFTQIQDLEKQEQSLSQTLQELNTNVDDLSGISRNYSDIERELQIATTNLNQFLSKREALQIDAAQREVPWEIITPPTSPTPQPESLPQNLMIGAMLGLLLGSAAALLIDKSGAIIYDDEEIRRLTQLPILARIPMNQTLSGGKLERFSETLQYEDVSEESMTVQAVSGSEVNGHSAPITATLPWKRKSVDKAYYDSDPFSESFRLLLANLQKPRSGQRVRSVVVSSATAGEGKSTVAIYLAEAAAAMGQRVLIVDADLRNPTIHKYLELSNEKGLTSLFAGVPNPAVIQKFPDNPTLYVMCSGSYNIEPSRVLTSSTLQKMIQKMQHVFDLIIFDTSPLLGQSDAYLLAKHADGLLLVAQSGKVTQPHLDRAMEQLRTADISVFGVVSREN